MKRRQFSLFVAALLTGGSLVTFSEEAEALKRKKRRKRAAYREKQRNEWLDSVSGNQRERHDRNSNRQERRERDKSRKRQRSSWEKAGHGDCSACW